MNKKTVRKTGIAIAGVIFLLAVSYIGLAEYYKSGFSYGTWINGVYCTGKTVEEVNEELLKACVYDGLTIYDAKGESFFVKAEDIGFTFDFQEALSLHLSVQHPYLWGYRLFATGKKELVPDISFNEDRLWEILESSPAFLEKKAGERQVWIVRTDGGYILVDERKGVLNEEKAKKAVRRSLLAVEAELDLEASGCYEDLPYTEEMKETLAIWERVKEFQDCRITYCFGEERVSIDASVVCDWMAVDENGEFRYSGEGKIEADEEKIEAFVNQLADEYDTVGTTRYFQATRGETVEVEGGAYGNRMDREAEKEYLKQAFAEKREEMHLPTYIQEGRQQGKDDIGSTYIEVDMGEQMMYYYLNGRLELETPIVTGNTGRRWGTPEGVNYVYAKGRNRVLRGPGYESHVNFWMPVKGNIGIHDAAWRKEFGGEIYKSAGSHGCINTPYDAMSDLYDMVEIGTPVVMFY